MKAARAFRGDKGGPEASAADSRKSAVKSRGRNSWVRPDRKSTADPAREEAARSPAFAPRRPPRAGPGHDDHFVAAASRKAFFPLSPIAGLDPRRSSRTSLRAPEHPMDRSIPLGCGKLAAKPFRAVFSRTESEAGAASPFPRSPSPPRRLSPFPFLYPRREMARSRGVKALRPTPARYPRQNWPPL